MIESLRAGGSTNLHAALQTALRNLPKPTIAAIHGYAFGVGLDLAMACDFRIAMEDAVLRDQRVMERGMHAVTGCAWFHPRVLGVTRALEFLIMGEPLSGREAAELGMVNRAVTAGAFGDEGSGSAVVSPAVAAGWCGEVVGGDEAVD